MPWQHPGEGCSMRGPCHYTGNALAGSDSPSGCSADARKTYTSSPFAHRPLLQSQCLAQSASLYEIHAISFASWLAGFIARWESAFRPGPCEGGAVLASRACAGSCPFKALTVFHSSAWCFTPFHAKRDALWTRAASAKLSNRLFAPGISKAVYGQRKR